MSLMSASPFDGKESLRVLCLLDHLMERVTLLTILWLRSVGVGCLLGHLMEGGYSN